MNLAEEAVGGLAAGVVGTVIGFPLDLVKTRMQTSSTPAMNMVGVATHVVRTEGILALYKGIAPPMISLSILNTMGFTSYSYWRKVYGGQNGWDPINGLAGMTGAPVFSIVSTLENLVKTQMQVDNVSTKRFDNSWRFVTTVVRERGFALLYTGHGINTLREAAFCGSYFFAYEGFREMVLSVVPTQTTAVPIAGGLAGASAWTFSFPLDCVRARIQSRNLFSTTTATRTNALQVLFQLIREQGVAGLYNGVGPSVTRAFLVSGTRFSAYEGALWLLRGGRDNDNNRRRRRRSTTTTR